MVRGLGRRYRLKSAAAGKLSRQPHPVTFNLQVVIVELYKGLGTSHPPCMQ